MEGCCGKGSYTTHEAIYYLKIHWSKLKVYFENLSNSKSRKQKQIGITNKPKRQYTRTLKKYSVQMKAEKEKKNERKNRWTNRKPTARW